jgi:hypothetical protein
MNQDLRNAYPALALLDECATPLTAERHGIAMTPGMADQADALEAAEQEARMLTYRRLDPATRLYITILACSLWALSWVTGKKR